MATKHHTRINLAKSGLIIGLMVMATTGMSAETSPDIELAGAGISIFGSTRHPALASAVVEIKFGTETVTGSTDTEGKYSISFDCNEGDAVVFIYVHGSGEQSHVKAARVVDSCAALNTAAGGSGEFQVGSVSPVSTAAYAILRWHVENLMSLDWPPSANEMLVHRHSVAGLFAGTALASLPSMIAGAFATARRHEHNAGSVTRSSSLA